MEQKFAYFIRRPFLWSSTSIFPSELCVTQSRLFQINLAARVIIRWLRSQSVIQIPSINRRFQINVVLCVLSISIYTVSHFNLLLASTIFLFFYCRTRVVWLRKEYTMPMWVDDVDIIVFEKSRERRSIFQAELDIFLGTEVADLIEMFSKHDKIIFCINRCTCRNQTSYRYIQLWLWSAVKHSDIYWNR